MKNITVLSLLISIHLPGFTSSVPSYISNSTAKCPSACDCVKMDQGLDVICCAKDKQASVPLLPADTVKLDLSACRIKTLPPQTFRNAPLLSELVINNGGFTTISNQSFGGLDKLTILCMKHGKLKTLDPGSFGALPSLQSLILDYNPLPLAMLPAVFSGLNKRGSMKDISLEGINRNQDSYTEYYANDTTLKLEYVVGLTGLRIDKFNLRFTAIYSINDDVIPVFINTLCLNLGENKFNYLSIISFFNAWSPMLIGRTIVLDLHEESLSPNLQPDFHQQCEDAKQDKKLLTCPRLSMSEIQKLRKKYPKYKVVTFYSWRRLNAKNGFPFGWFGHVIALPNNLTHLYLDGDIAMTLGLPVFGLTCLRHFSISRGPIAKINDPTIFSHMPSLEVLNLSQCSIESQMITYEQSVVQNLISIKTIDLSFNNIPEITFAHVPLHAPKLENLYLQHNHLTHIPDIKSRSLKVLDLRHNKLSVFDERETEILEALNRDTLGNVIIALEGNLFLCLCNSETYNFITWIQTTSVSIVGKKSLTCLNDATHRKAESILLEINLTRYRAKCQHDLILTVTGSVITAFTVSAAACFIIYRKRWELTLWYYKQKLRHSNGSRMEANNGGYVYILPCCNVNGESAEFYRFASKDLPRKLAEEELRPLVHLTSNPRYAIVTADMGKLDGICRSVDRCKSFILLVCPDLLRQYGELEHKRMTDWALLSALDRNFETDEFFNILTYGDLELSNLPELAQHDILGSFCRRAQQISWPLSNKAKQDKVLKKLVQRIRESGVEPVLDTFGPSPQPLPESSPEVLRRGPPSCWKDEDQTPLVHSEDS